MVKGFQRHKYTYLFITFVCLKRQLIVFSNKAPYPIIRFTNGVNKYFQMKTAEDIIRFLDLKPHPEGGYYREIYRSDETTAKESLHSRYTGARCFGTGIYYLLTKNDVSVMHRIKSDEIFHFYMGDTAEMLKLYPDGTGEIIEIGTDPEKGIMPCAIVGKGVWQGLKLKEGGSFVLFGTTVCPGFDFDDFEYGDIEKLQNDYPYFSEKISQFSR
jgi:uncharacterized protein